VLRKLFVPKRGKQEGDGEHFIMRSFMICTCQILFRNVMGWTCNIF